MKRILMIVAALLALSLLAAAQQPLGDIARDLKKNKDQEKKPAKVYDNDNLPSSGAINTAAAAPAEKPSAKDEKSADKEKDEAAKAQTEWKQRIADAKKEIASVQRELDLLQRENRMRGAVYYADAGTRLRDEKKFAEDDRKYQADITDKQKALEAAKQKLDDLRDQGRKAGMPPAVLD